jgi:hypothetical protein
VLWLKTDIQSDVTPIMILYSNRNTMEKFMKLSSRKWAGGVSNSNGRAPVYQVQVPEVNPQLYGKKSETLIPNI